MMRSSSCGGGGAVSKVELLGSKTVSFHPDKDDNCNINGSKPAFWNKMSDEGFYRQAGQLTSLHNEEAFVDHDLTSAPEAKELQRKYGKAARSNGNSSRKSRASHMEANLNVTGIVDVNDLLKETGSYPGKYNIADKTSRKRSEKRNGKLPKSKSDTFSVKAGLSSFSSSAGGNSILGIYGSKHDICDFAKHVDEISLNELLDGSYKCPDSIKVKEQSTEDLNGSILLSVREACSVLHLQKPAQTPVPAGDAIYNHNALSLLTNSSTDDGNKVDAPDSSPCIKADSSRSGPTDHHANILQFPLFEPKDVLDRLNRLPHKDLDLMLLDSMKPTSTSKVHSGGSLPTFPWSHVSGVHFKVNPDVVKSTPSKSTCQGRWMKMGKLITSVVDPTTYLADFQSLTYDQNLVPIGSQQTESTEKENSLLVSTLERGVTVTPSGTQTTASKIPVGNSAGVLSAAQTLCNIAALYRKQSHNGITSWQKKSSQKSIRASKLTSDEKLEKALFSIPSSRTNLINSPDDSKSQTPKKLKFSTNDFMKGPYHWSTVTPQSIRSSSSPNKSFKNAPDAKHHESSSSPLKRSITAPPAKLPNKPPKLRKLVPMEWKSRSGYTGNAKY